jgi:hypothetical protein
MIRYSVAAVIAASALLTTRLLDRRRCRPAGYAKQQSRAGLRPGA